MNIPVSHCLKCGKWFKEDGDVLCPKCQPDRTAGKVVHVVMSEELRRKVGDFRADI